MWFADAFSGCIFTPHHIHTMAEMLSWKWTRVNELTWIVRHFVLSSGLITPGGFSSVPAGMETPELIELRKKKIEEAMDG